MKRFIDFRQRYRGVSRTSCKGTESRWTATAPEPAIWDALFQHGLLLLVDAVQQEIANWIHDPRGVNTQAHDFLSHVPSDYVAVLDLSTTSEWIRWALAYYVNLLGFRRETVTMVQCELAEQAGKQPTRQDVHNVVKTRFGERGLRLARKSDQCSQQEHRYNDEAIVMFAITHALCSGEETIILTHDENGFEQFYKGIWLLDTHWRSMLMANFFAEDSRAFGRCRYASRAPSQVVNVLEQVFDVGSVDAVFMNKPSADRREVLPSRLTSVAVQCVLVKDRVNLMKFGLVKEMLEI